MKTINVVMRLVMMHMIRKARTIEMTIPMLVVIAAIVVHNVLLTVKTNQQKALKCYLFILTVKGNTMNNALFRSSIKLVIIISF